MEKNQEVEKYFVFAKNLTLEAGKMLKGAMHSEKKVQPKGNFGDLVTESDKEIEQMLISCLKSEYPEHKFIAEESTLEIQDLTDEPTWIIDPIDGTINFVHSFPQCCISIGLTINKVVELGIIYNPSNDELYTAIKGQGAYLNGNRLYVSPISKLSQALIIIEPGVIRVAGKFRDIFEGRMNALICAAEGVRNVGSAALAMAYVASGIIDVFHVDHLKPWDVAAGYLLVREAGGIVIDTKGGSFNIMEPMTIAASNESLAKEISKLIIDTDLQTQRKRFKRT